jgi:hypothetical protein
MNPELGEGLCEISPERSGNWSHLVNHAPTTSEPDENHEETINDNIRDKIEFANIEEQWTDINGYWYPILVAKKNIPKGKQLLFDYEPYWQNWLSRQGKLRYFIIENDSYQIVNRDGKQTSDLQAQGENLAKIKKILDENAGKGYQSIKSSNLLSPFWQQEKEGAKKFAESGNKATLVEEYKHGPN